MDEQREYQLKDEADERLDKVVARAGPRAGQVWRHYKEADYLVLGTSILEDNGTGLVNYRATQPRLDASGRLRQPRNRSRRIEVWHESVTLPSGEILPRFRLLREELHPLDRTSLALPDGILEPMPKILREAIHEVVLELGGERVLLRDKVNGFLTELWHGHVYNASDVALAFSHGVVHLLAGLGLLRPTEVENWLEALARCPGHECQGSWCAYCGHESFWELCPPGQCEPCDRRRSARRGVDGEVER